MHKFINALRRNVFGTILLTVHTVIHFLDELQMAVASYVLALALLLGATDSAMNNAISKQYPEYMFWFAFLLALGVEAQIRACAARILDAVAHLCGWARVLVIAGWVALGLFVGAIAFQMLVMFGVQHQLGYTQDQSLAVVHLDPVMWWAERAVAVVILIFVGKLAPYHLPKFELNTDEVVAGIEHDAKVAQARYAANQAQHALEMQKREHHVDERVQSALNARKVVAAAVKGKGVDATVPVGYGTSKSGPDNDDPNGDGPDGNGGGNGPRRGGRGRAAVPQIAAPSRELARVTLTDIGAGAISGDLVNRSADSAPMKSHAGRSATLSAQTREERIEAIMQAIRDCYYEQNRMPSVRAILTATGIKSTSTVSQMLPEAKRRLYDEGFRFEMDGSIRQIMPAAEMPMAVVAEAAA